MQKGSAESIDEHNNTTAYGIEFLVYKKFRTSCFSAFKISDKLFLYSSAVIFSIPSLLPARGTSLPEKLLKKWIKKVRADKSKNEKISFGIVE